MFGTTRIVSVPPADAAIQRLRPVDPRHNFSFGGIAVPLPRLSCGGILPFLDELVGLSTFSALALMCHSSLSGK